MKLPDTCAVIFDIDGVLLYLTEAEEDMFFRALEDVHGITGASRDWNSYRVRNDVEIIEELIEKKFERQPEPGEIRQVMDRYGALLEIAIRSGSVEVKSIPGITPVLTELGWQNGVKLGVATANLKVAADIRLKAAGLKEWFAIGGYADARGPKAEILAQVIKHARDDQGNPIPPERTVFLGDNPNDVEAGRRNGCRFIGFAADNHQYEVLRGAGAETIITSHNDTLAAISHALSA
ncbi:MAG: HAD family hydrolase [Hyphomicrobiales bacterium]